MRFFQTKMSKISALRGSRCLRANQFCNRRVKVLVLAHGSQTPDYVQISACARVCRGLYFCVSWLSPEIFMAFMFFGSLNLDSGPRYGSLLAPGWQRLLKLAGVDVVGVLRR